MHDMSNEGKGYAHPLLRCLKKPQEHSAEKQLAGGRAFMFLPLVQVHFPVVYSDFYEVLESCRDLLML